MNFKKLLIVTIFAIISIYTYPFVALADDLGVSPPYIRNAGLAPGSHYEQTIFLTRSDAEEDLEVQIEFGVPGASNWFSIDKGNKFILPKGETKFPLIFSVDVPAQSAFGRYKGNIRITTKSAQEKEGGQVSLAFGILVDVDINVVAMKIVDYRVRGVKINDVEETYKIGFINPPGIVNFSVQIENKGNVKSSPSKVMLVIYDSQRTKIIQTIETSQVPKVKPFSTEWVTARIPVFIQAGSYPAVYKIYRDDNVISQGDIHLSVMPKDQVKDYKGATFFDLKLTDQLSLIVFGIIILSILFFIGFGIYKAINHNQTSGQYIREPRVRKEPRTTRKVVKRIVRRKKIKKE